MKYREQNRFGISHNDNNRGHICKYFPVSSCDPSSACQYTTTGFNTHSIFPASPPTTTGFILVGGEWTKHTRYKLWSIYYAPSDPRDLHWNSDPNTHSWVMDRMVEANVNTVVLSYWSDMSQLNPSPMDMDPLPSPQLSTTYSSLLPLSLVLDNCLNARYLNILTMPFSYR